MSVVYTKLVGDLFHVGHVNFLKQARGLGSVLVVHVVDDLRVENAKRKPIMTQSERAAVVESCRFVDRVVLDGPKVLSQSFMTEHGYDLYVFACANEHEREVKSLDCGDLAPDQYQCLTYTEGVSTTDVIRRVMERSVLGDPR